MFKRGDSLAEVLSKKSNSMDSGKMLGTKRKRGRPPNPRRGSLQSKNSNTTDSPTSDSTKISDSSSATEEETSFTLRLILPCSGCGEPSANSTLVVICDLCKKGYHQLCHVPRIPQVFLEDTERPWRCQSCVPRGSVRKSAKNFRANTKALYDASALPPLSLSENGYDSENAGDTTRLCYCLQEVVRKDKMLQCRKCSTAFHEQCVKCLEWPLLIGDVFYNFRCARCTQGMEFLQRLPLSWVDVTEIVLYQLHKGRPELEAFEPKSEIFPYLDSVWSLLQVPQELEICTVRERHSHVLYCLRQVVSRYRSIETRDGFDGAFFARSNPNQLPSLSALHWRLIRESMNEQSNVFLGMNCEKLSFGDSSHCDEDSCSSTITTSSATSIASKPQLDIFDTSRRKDEGEEDEEKTQEEKIEESDSMRKKLRPRAVALPPEKKIRRKKKTTKTVINHDDEDEEDDNDQGTKSDNEQYPLVTTSLAWIPIPENFEGVNNPFYESEVEEEEGNSQQTVSAVQQAPRAAIRKWKLTSRDLVVGKDGTVRCKRLRRRVSGAKNPTLLKESSETTTESPLPVLNENNPREFKFKSSMESLSEGTKNFPGCSTSSGKKRCRYVEYKGEETLIQMAFRNKVLARRTLLDGTTQLLLKR